MNAILGALMVTVLAALDYGLVYFEHKRWSKAVKGIIVGLLIVIAWVAAIAQYRDGKSSREDMNFLKGTLATANVALTNSVKLSLELQTEVTRLRKQTDNDVVNLAGQMIDSISFNIERGEAEYRKGLFALATGRAELAKGHFKKAIELSRENSRAHNNLALLLAAEGNKEGAFEHYRLANKADKKNAAAAHNYAMELVRQGKIPEATEVLGAPDDVTEGVPEAVVADAFFLSKAGRTNFFAFLSYYVKNSSSPSVEMTGTVLLRGWNLMGSDQRASITNWSDYFATQAEKEQFRYVCEGLRSMPPP